MSELKEYIVTAQTMVDADSIIADMESPDGNLYIPNRQVDITQLRELSRNTHFMLSDEEAVQLRTDPRVIAVERPPRDMGIEVVHHWTQSGNFEKYEIIDTNDKNWGLYRITAGNTLTGWGTPTGTFTQTTQTVTTTSSGKNVDVVVVDSHINPLHPEFAVNIDGTGGSRVNQYNWFALSSIVGVNTVGTYDYSNISSNHGTHVAGTVAGNTQGWARDSNIYNMEFSYAGANSPGNWELYIFDYLRAFHKNKTINATTGRKNPTITNHSWGYSYGDIQLSSITSVTYRGVTTALSGTDADKKIILEANGVPVPNNTYLYRTPYTYAALNADVADAIADGVIVVAAAGNSYWNSAYSDNQDYNNSIRSSGVDYVHSRGSSPAVTPGVIVVGNITTRQEEYKNPSSNFGNRVDIWAPGTNIVSAVYNANAATEFTITLVDDPRNSSYKLGSISGTSMASPQVCGLLACYAEQNLNLSASEALAYLIIHSKKNQVGTIGASYDNYRWFGDSGNNRYLFYKLERPLSGQSLPKTTFKNRPPSGAVYPRISIRKYG